MAGAATEWETPNAWILGSTGSVLYKGTTMPPAGGCEVYPFNKNEVEQFKNFMAEMRNRLSNVKGLFWQPNGEASHFVATPFWGSNMNLKKEVIKAFNDCRKIFPNEHIRCFDNIDSLDIMIASVNKAEGLRWVANMLDISLEDCYALGDSDNDLPMLQLCQQYKHDFVVGSHEFKGNYKPTFRFEPNDYEGMLSMLLSILHCK